MDGRFEALAGLAVHGANVQPGQVVSVSASIGQEEAARAIAAAAYGREAKFVDVLYFDPYVKRARIEFADPDTLEYVPDWLEARLAKLAERGDARISLSGTVSPDALAGLDPALVGRDQLPWLKSVGRVVSERLTNWCGIACPTRDWAAVVHPELPPDEAYERLWDELRYVLRLDEPDPAAAWEERARVLRSSAATLTERGFDRIELHGPGTDLSVGLLPTSRWEAAEFVSRSGIRHLANLPTEEIFTTPDPLRTEGHVASTKPLVLSDGTVIRGLRVRFEGGRAVEVEADENAAALRTRTAVDEGAARLGEIALVDRHGRIGQLETVFYNTLIDENSASHIALGTGFAFAVGDEDAGRINDSDIHIDFMIGSPELEVDGVTLGGERVPILRAGEWQV